MMSKTKKLLCLVASLAVLSLNRLLWHSETKPETPKAAQGGFPPAATPSVETNITSPNSPAGGSKVTSGEIPLQVGRHAANGEFPYPFLGSVKAYVQPQTLRLHSSSGSLAEFPVKVFYSESGNFIRAEFVKPGAGDFQTPVKTVQAASRQSFEIVTGLPEKTLSVGLESLLERLQMPFEDATRFNLTYVLFRKDDGPPEPTILLNVFGLPSLVTARLGDREAFRRIRIVMDQNGKVKWEDNML